MKFRLKIMKLDRQSLLPIYQSVYLLCGSLTNNFSPSSNCITQDFLSFDISIQVEFSCGLFVSKSFDCMDRDILFQQLFSEFGMASSAWQLFSEFEFGSCSIDELDRFVSLSLETVETAIIDSELNIFMQVNSMITYHLNV